MCVAQSLQSCPTLCDPVECSPPGSSVIGVSQARILKWVTTSFYRGSSRLTDQTCISYIAGEFFTIKPPANAGDMRRGFSPWVRKIPWRRTWQLTPAFFLENPKDRGAWRARVPGVTKSWTQPKRLSMHTCTWEAPFHPRTLQ